MHDEQHWKRLRTIERKRIKDHRPTVAGRSMILHGVLGYGKVNKPFLAPPPVPSADIVSSPTVSVAAAFSEHPRSLSSTTASTEWAPTADIDIVGQHIRKDEPTPRFREATTSAAKPIAKNSLPHLSANFKTQVNVDSSSKDPAHVGPTQSTKRKYHPDLLGFTFPAAPTQEVKTASHMGGSSSAVSAESQALGYDFTPVAPSPQRAASSEFHIYKDKGDIDAEGETCGDDRNNVQNNVLSDMLLKHIGATTNDDNTTQSSLQQYPAPPQSPCPPATQCNVVPNLEDIFDQWFRFGRQNWEGLCLLQPREIPIESITARTLPCVEPYVPAELREKPVKLFTITENQDVAALKMFEIEVLPESEDARLALFNIIDRGPNFHETSTAKPTVWTVLFVREKEQRFVGYNFKGSKSFEDQKTGTRVHVAKRRRSVQDLDVEAPLLGEDSAQHSWQIMAWPSAHTSRFLEVSGPVRTQVSSNEELSNKPQGRSAAGRAPLAPKTVQVRQNLATHESGRVHLKDARAYAEYNTTARAHADTRHCASDSVLRFAEDQENAPFSPQRSCCLKVDVVKGRVEQTSTSMSGDINSVLVHERQRLTCVRFQRGGAYPLLTGKGVDLNYWNTFCEYFCKGEVQLEVWSPADGEPVVLSEEEEQRRRGTKTENAPTQEEHAKDMGKDGLDPFLTGGRTSDTPIPELMRSTMQHGHIDLPDSTPPLQKQHTQYDTQSYLPQRGTRNGYQFAPDVQNTRRQQSLHQLPSLNKPSVHPQHSHATSIPDGSSTMRFQNLGHYRNSSSETIKVRPDVDSPSDTPTAMPPAFGWEFGGSSTHTGPLLRGWQMEMLDALEKKRSPAWKYWTDRSMNYDRRMEAIELENEVIAQEAFADWPSEVHVLRDTRATRDGNTLVECYNEEAIRRYKQYHDLKGCRRFAEQVADDDRLLKRREQRLQPLEYMKDVRLRQLQRAYEKGRVSSPVARRALWNQLCVDKSRELQEVYQNHREVVQQQLQQVASLKARGGAYGGSDQTYQFQQQQEAQQPPASSFGRQPFPPQQQQQAAFDHAYDQLQYSAPYYTHHGQYTTAPQPTYEHTQQPQAPPPFHDYNNNNNTDDVDTHLQRIDQAFNRHTNDAEPAFPPVIQQRAPAPRAADNADADAPSYFVWNHVSGAPVPARGPMRRRVSGNAKASAVESAALWSSDVDDDDEEEEEDTTDGDEEEDEYFETGWY
ncbi:uncharacterized protein BKCO1_500005 [Diplodia corticola]|uniref:Uncharacterized protein n=1 Tax=Diplodia corticola TaxID=236234 RepID=A0A1J9RTU6_9PEZI|nr:uncharacterized protein BKCO1_500005 [Diplodia corticola]OJD31292.1 hypothetical protein BKCO1_500005 [Diplodia corticola]